jgi:hypothetical protein
MNRRQSATANPDRDTRAKRLRVREFRPVCWHLDESETEEAKASKEAAEAEQSQVLAFSLSASLAFSSLSLLPFSGQPLPSQTTASDLRAHDTEPLSIRQLPLVVAERLLIEITEQMKRFHADIRALELSLDHAPEIFHRIRVDVPIGILNGVINHGMLCSPRKARRKDFNESLNSAEPAWIFSLTCL